MRPVLWPALALISAMPIWAQGPIIDMHLHTRYLRIFQDLSERLSAFRTTLYRLGTNVNPTERSGGTI
jgi:hypothetical protein